MKKRKKRRGEGMKERKKMNGKKNIYQELKMLRTQLDEFKMSERRFDNWLKGQDMKKCKFLIMT